MRKLLITLAVIFCHVSPAQDFKSLSFLDARSRSAYSVVATPITTIRSILGTRHSLLLQGFGGTSLDNGRMVAGLALTFDVRLAENVSLTLGPAAWIENRRARSAGLLAGVTVKF